MVWLIWRATAYLLNQTLYSWTNRFFQPVAGCWSGLRDFRSRWPPFSFPRKYKRNVVSHGWRLTMTNKISYPDVGKYEVKKPPISCMFYANAQNFGCCFPAHRKVDVFPVNLIKCRISALSSRKSRIRHDVALRNITWRRLFMPITWWAEEARSQELELVLSLVPWPFLSLGTETTWRYRQQVTRTPCTSNYGGWMTLTTCGSQQVRGPFIYWMLELDGGDCAALDLIALV